MLKLCRDAKAKMFFLELVYVFSVNLSEISAAILEKGLLDLVLYNLGSNRACNFKSALVLVGFWNFSHNCSLNRTPFDPINITNQLPDY